MDDVIRMWVEIPFNILYLIIIYTLIIKMLLKYRVINANHQNTSNLRCLKYFIIAFIFLALGDTGHVGFRVLAYALGGLESTVFLFNNDISLIGLGSLLTAYTLTIFYMIFLDIWRIQFSNKISVIYIILMFSAFIRLVIMVFPQNCWFDFCGPFDWVMYRNIPLIIIGIGVAILFLLDSGKNNDKTFKLFGIMILLSHAFYIPVILLNHKIPVIGVLMIPKTIVYLIIAFIGYRNLFRLNK